MSTEAKLGIGAVLNRWDTTSPAAWEEIVEITAISVGGISRNVIEVFKLNNADDYVNKIQGILNAGSISVTINYTLAQYLILKADMETRGNKSYQIVLPDGEGIEFDGFITELPLDIGSDAVMSGEISIEVDGAIDLVSSASASPA